MEGLPSRAARRSSMLRRGGETEGLFGPPAYTFVSTNEPFYSETVTFIENLRKAEVPAEIDVYPGLFHAFDMLKPSLEASKDAAWRFNEWVGAALERYFAKQE